ncbi:hypothetical protein NMY22_g16125 [Coprinellus aureogranulatus]|nr:hypothetical protein NMY22_g16125 [Coprinellus aureogranulatus]
MSYDRLNPTLLQLKASTLIERQASLKGRLNMVSRQRADAGRRRNGDLPISKLPQELLSRIFILLHSSQTLDGSLFSETKRCTQSNLRIRKDRCTTGRVEVTISQVCHHWREVCLRLPALWSVFWCDKPPSCAALVRESQRLKDYLSRSAQEDLELYFNLTMAVAHPESAVERENFRIVSLELLDLAVPHAHRWRNFSIVANDSSRRLSLTRFRKAISCISTPRLERFVVCVGSSYYHSNQGTKGGWENQVFLLQGGVDGTPCPRLRYLKLDGGGLRQCRPPIHSLAHLSLEYGPPRAPDDGVAKDFASNRYRFTKSS